MGRRKGLEIRWADLVSGEAALATALNASLTAPLERLPRKTKIAGKCSEPRTASSRTCFRGHVVWILLDVCD
jgi:hypothetical protein